MRFHVAGAEQDEKYRDNGCIAPLCGERGPVRVRLGHEQERLALGDQQEWCPRCMILWDEHEAAGRIQEVALVNEKTIWKSRGCFVWLIGSAVAGSEWRRSRVRRRVEMVVANRLRVADSRSRAKAAP